MDLISAITYDNYKKGELGLQTCVTFETVFSSITKFSQSVV